MNPCRHIGLERRDGFDVGRDPRGMAEAWTCEGVAEHFEEAFRTLRKLPPVRTKGYVSAWPEIMRSVKEMAAMEPEPMRVWPGSRCDHAARADLRLDALDHGGGAQADLAARGARALEADHLGVRLRPHHCVAPLDARADQDRGASECAVTPACCNTLSFDICNI
jgi:hypothetical protein